MAVDGNAIGDIVSYCFGAGCLDGPTSSAQAIGNLSFKLRRYFRLCTYWNCWNELVILPPRTKLILDEKSGG